MLATLTHSWLCSTPGCKSRHTTTFCYWHTRPDYPVLPDGWIIVQHAQPLTRAWWQHTRLMAFCARCAAPILALIPDEVGR